MPDAQFNSVDDARLIELAAAGDGDAFGALVDRHEAAISRFARALAGDPAAAEDAVQETFISAWRNAASYAGAASAKPWLFTIARNAVRRQYRLRVGQPSQLESLSELGSSAGWGRESDHASFVRRLESRHDIEAAVARLSEEDRAVLYSIDVEGLSYAEAAGVIEVTPQAVKSRVHRARLRLMAILREDADA